MKRVFSICLLGLLLILVIALPAYAGGWAAITLEEWPTQIVAGTPLAIRFAVRQHGVTLLPGLDPVINLKNTGSGKTLSLHATPVEGQPGFYEATLTFPDEGTWEWSIQAFTMNQSMPDLQVSAGGLAPTIEAPQPSPGPFTTVMIGLGLVVLITAFTIRKKIRWSLALVILGLLIGGAGFALVATKLSPGSKALAKGAPPSAALVTGEDLFVAKGCVTCHANRNIDQKYYDFTSEMGPDLTRYSSSPDYLRLWLKDPASVKPNTKMPNLGLDSAEIEALIAFINRNSGKATPTIPPTQAPEKVVTATPVAQKPVGKDTTCSDSDIPHSLLVDYSRDDGSYIAPVDPISGLPLCGADRMDLSYYPMYAFSNDRLNLAVLSAETTKQDNFRLRWIDLLSWKAIDTGVVFSSWSQSLAVHPDNKHVVIANSIITQEKEPRLLGYNLVQVDVSRKYRPGDTMMQVNLDIDPRLIGYTGGGHYIFVYGVKYDYLKGTITSPARVELFNASDLSLAWQKELEDVQEGVNHIGEGTDPDQYTQAMPALTLSTDRNKLYIVHADDDRLTTVDFLNRESKTVDIQLKLNWLEKLISLTATPAQAKGLNGTMKQAILSPDGSLLYVTGTTGIVRKDRANNWQFDEVPLGLQVIDVAQGREVGQLKSDATEVSLSSDGSLLFLRGWGDHPWTDVLATKNLHILQHIDWQLLFPANTLSGGELLLGSDQGTTALQMKVLDPGQFTQIALLKGDGYWITALPGR
jgi:mono/diheme cytochrome c family protein